MIRVGMGYDVHKLTEGRDLILGGVNIPWEKGLMGHSDADVVVHAIMDALLGAAALRDIGRHFPDTDPQYKGISLSLIHILWLIPIGLVVGVIYYVVFRFVIVKFDMKTPGREDDDMDETKVELANNDFTGIAKIVLEGVGGAANVTSIDNCITRLRLEIKDYTLVDEKKIKSAGVAGVIRPSKTAVQVIVGTKVQFVADEFKKLCK